MLSALLFDLDGTLANTDPFHFLAWQEMLQPYEFVVDRAFYQKHISGRLNPDIVADLLPQLSGEEKLLFCDRKEARFRELAAQLPALPGVVPLIHWATAQGLKQALVTNAPRDNTTHMLQTLGLAQSFDLVILGEELERGKPDPLPYERALGGLGVAAQNALAFEDSPTGIRSAVAAGIPTVGIASTHATAALEAAGAMLVVPDFAAPELLNLLPQPVMAG